MESNWSISGQLIDLFSRRIYPAIVTVKDGIIASIEETQHAPAHFILPGFIDAHVHIESSMLPPTSFARLAVVHGTVAAVSDPHEIANVCGLAGINYMIENSKKTVFKFFFGAPSCVPATPFETGGAVIDSTNIVSLLASKDIWYLSEVMNYPGVLNKNPEVMAKITAAKTANKPIDGHAPGLLGEQAKAYAEAGITTDHESVIYEEALGKAALGIHCLIREGSAAKNFDALIDILRVHPEKVMFCSDDKHPDELVLGHIGEQVKRALRKGFDLFDVLSAACVNPVLHYNLPVGLLRIGEPADFIVVEDFRDFKILETYINGQLVAKIGQSLLPHIPAGIINNFEALTVTTQNFAVKAKGKDATIRVIEAIDGQLMTSSFQTKGKVTDGFIVSNTEDDILKIAVVNRYRPNELPSVAFIKNFGLSKGAIASSVAHDCHNIVVVGVDDESIAMAVNALIEVNGGLAVVKGDQGIECLPLPIAGIMSPEDCYCVAEKYQVLHAAAKDLGSKLQSPFMTLSFMALLVIPALKLSDKGLFDGNSFEFTDVQV